MTTITMPTIDRRTRTSDGTITCCLCHEIIENKERYVQDSCSDSGVLVQRDVCMSCWMAKDGGDFFASIGVLAAVVIILAVTAALLG